MARISNKAVMDWSRDCPYICLNGLTKAMKNNGTANVSHYIQTTHLINTSIEYYHHTNLFSDYHHYHSYCCLNTMMMMVIMDKEEAAVLALVVLV
jgi:hypothetical protein